MARLLTYCVWLTLVLGHTGVYAPMAASVLFAHKLIAAGDFLLDDIWANGGPEDSWERVGRATGLPIRRSDGDGGSCRHCRG